MKAPDFHLSDQQGKEHALSDESLSTIKSYGAWGKKKFMGKEYDGILRNTYLINPKGEIVKTYLGVKPDGHSKEILQDLDTLLVKSAETTS